MAEMEMSQVMPKVITVLSSLLQRLADTIDSKLGSGPEKVSVFHGLTRPSISIQSYLERIFKYANCSPSCFVVAYVYLDRFAQRQPLLPINSFTVHRLLITSVLVAAKFMDDMYYNNAYYAKVGGISTTEMNILELDFLFGLGFHLNVTPASFQTYHNHLQMEMLMAMDPPLVPTVQPLKIHCSFSEEESNSQHKQQQSTERCNQLPQLAMFVMFITLKVGKGIWSSNQQEILFRKCSAPCCCTCKLFSS